MKKQEVKREIESKSLSVAVKQAMRYEMNLTFRDISSYTGVALKNVCSHVYAKRGSNVRSWEDRTPEQRAEAIALAKKYVSAGF